MNFLFLTSNLKIDSDHSCCDHSCCDRSCCDRSCCDRSCCDHSCCDHSCCNHSCCDHSYCDHSCCEGDSFPLSSIILLHFQQEFLVAHFSTGTVPTVDDFAPEYLDKLPKDIILEKITRTSRRGNVDYLRVGFKKMHPNKARWMEKEKAREQFPHFPID